MSKKLKLKGRNTDRLKPKQKKKMQKTLNKMKETRKKDSINMRDLAESKLKWAIEERERGLSTSSNTQVRRDYNSFRRIIR